MKHRVKELCRTLIILSLLLSVALLSLTAVSYSGTELPWLSRLAAWLEGGTELPPRKAQALAISDAASPLLISVRTDAGRASFRGRSGDWESVYGILGGYLAEALDTAGEPSPILAEDFQRAALGDGVLFRYPGEIPLPVLATWLDASCGAACSADRFLLELRNGKVRLLASGSSGTFAMETQAGAEALLRALRSYPDDGTRLAGEAGPGPYRHLDPLTLVDPSLTSLPAAARTDPCDEAFLIRAAGLLGFNPYGDASYRDTSGSIVFTEGDCSLRVDADGVLHLQDSSQTVRFRAAGSDDAARIEYVRALLEQLSGDQTGDASLQFSGLWQEEGQVTVAFSYILDGLPVELGGAGAEARFSGASLCDLRFRVRSYVLSQTEQIYLLPPAQAAAALEVGAELRPAYADRGQEKLSAGWLQ